MGIALRSASSANIGATRQSSLTLTIPAGAISGDVLVAFISTNSAANTCSTPTGWTEDANSPSVASLGAFVACFYKVATGSDTNPTFNFNATRSACGWIGCYSGVDNVTPRNTSSKADGAGSLIDVVVIASIAMTSNEMVVSAFAWNSGTGATTTYTPGGGFTEEIDQCTATVTSSECAQSVNDKLFSAGGATGVISAKTANTGALSGLAIALNPVIDGSSIAWVTA